MKANAEKYLLPISFSLFALGCMVACSPDAFAAEGVSQGRKIWDNTMLVLNFGILVFVFIKFARKPLMNYLQSVRVKIEEELQEMKTKKNNAETVRDSEADKMKDLDRALDDLKTSIIEMGKREREQIIQQGKASAERMISDAKAYAEYRLTMARKALSDEMVEMAVAMVEKRLVKDITDEDQNNLIDHFVQDLEKSKAQLS